MAHKDGNPLGTHQHLKKLVHLLESFFVTRKNASLQHLLKILGAEVFVRTLNEINVFRVLLSKFKGTRVSEHQKYSKTSTSLSFPSPMAHLFETSLDVSNEVHRIRFCVE